MIELTLLQTGTIASLRFHEIRTLNSIQPPDPLAVRKNVDVCSHVKILNNPDGGVVYERCDELTDLSVGHGFLCTSHYNESLTRYKMKPRTLAERENDIIESIVSADQREINKGKRVDYLIPETRLRIHYWEQA